MHVWGEPVRVWICLGCCEPVRVLIVLYSWCSLILLGVNIFSSHLYHDSKCDVNNILYLWTMLCYVYIFNFKRVINIYTILNEGTERGESDNTYMLRHFLRKNIGNVLERRTLLTNGKFCVYFKRWAVFIMGKPRVWGHEVYMEALTIIILLALIKIN